MDKPVLEYGEIKIEACEGVYKPAEDTFLFLDNVKCGEKVLEIGTGTGIISILCAKRGSDVTSVDISVKAVNCAIKNAKTNGVEIAVFQSNLFENVKGKFDTIIFNPPYLPTEDKIDGSEQWDGGIDGFKATRPFLREAMNYLTDEATIYLVLSDQTDIRKLMSEFQEYRFTELDRKSFFYERIILYELKLP